MTDTFYLTGAVLAVAAVIGLLANRARQPLIVAYIVVAWFMRYVQNRGFVPFAIYRLVLGAVILVWAMRG